jgi:predicted PurR-regulated permease PerM
LNRPINPTRLISQGSVPTLETVAYACVIGAVLVGFLYFGRDILVPLALATLLSFALWPLIKVLRTWGAGRAPSVIVTVLLAVAGLVSLGTIMAMQVAELASELPRYESNLRIKVRALKNASMPSTVIEKAADTIQGLQEELNKNSTPSNAPAANTNARPTETLPQRSAGSASNPVVVEVREQEPSVMQSYQDLVKPLLSPLTTTALVVLFLIFILMQREDLRDRLLRIAGDSDIQRSTVAMNDAADRLSRFFLIQLMLNAGFGILIGIGLALIGVPSPVLWGLLAALMRFVPYVGSFIAAIFPIALAAAVDPNWTMVFSTVALFLVAEPVAGHVIEPILYGQSTGLSPVAVVVAALFWTIMWGPVGLLLSTPLTVCLVVLGKHVPALKFLDVVLGDEPALAPEQRLYQRLLAGDAGDAVAIAEEELPTMGLTRYFDQVAMKTLAMAQADANLGRLDQAAQSEILETVREVAAEFDDYPLESAAELPNGGADARQDTVSGGTSEVRQVFCLTTRTALDEAGAVLVGHVLSKRGLNPIAVSRATISEITDGRLSHPGSVICISHFGIESPFQVRTLVRRLKKNAPHTPIVAGFWMLGSERARLTEWQKLAGADFATSSLADAVELCLVANAPKHIAEATSYPVATQPVRDATESLAT